MATKRTKRCEAGKAPEPFTLSPADEVLAEQVTNDLLRKLGEAFCGPMPPQPTMLILDQLEAGLAELDYDALTRDALAWIRAMRAFVRP